MSLRLEQKKLLIIMLEINSKQSSLLAINIASDN